MERSLMTVNEIAETLGCGRTLVYQSIRRGQLPIIKLGRLTRIPTSSVEQVIIQAASGGLWSHQKGVL